MREKYLYYSILVALLLCPLGISAQTVTKVFNKTPLKTVLKEVERQTKMSIIYNVSEVNGQKKITATFNNEPVAKVLDRVLDSSLDYSIENKMITIYHRNKAQEKAKTTPQNRIGQSRTIQGTVVDSHGEPLIGVTVRIKNAQTGVVTDIDGKYSLVTKETAPTLEFSYIGYTPQSIVANTNNINVKLKEESSMLNEVVVTAMGIQRKEKSLTYATQQVKAEDLMRVQDPNVANTLEGKVSGITITPSAGGAGGASKIILRGNKSILGNNSPLIVVDGIPMSNGIRGQIGGDNITYSGASEGADPLSMINPDDIENINVLKGANAAALYGAAAANGVVMITTKKGKEGKLSISLASNVTADRVWLTPKLQRSYGAKLLKGRGVAIGAWGGKLSDLKDTELQTEIPLNSDLFPGQKHMLHLRNQAVDDVNEFFRTGLTANNSVSVSGGTEKIQTYFSMANSHAIGLVDNNSYNRNTLSFRQHYNLFKRLQIDASVNYVLTKTNNRPGGGTLLNPIYHLYNTPANIDMRYYQNNYSANDATWLVDGGAFYKQKENGDFEWLTGQKALLHGMRQEWAYMQGGENNPYWLTRMNSNVQNSNRVYGYLTGKLNLLEGLDFQARISIDHTNFTGEAKRYATTFAPVKFYPYGTYWKSTDRTEEIYTDYMLSYNKNFNKTWDVSATAGWVAHVSHSEAMTVDSPNATYISGTRQKMPTRINWFDTRSGDIGNTSSSKNTNWDKAALFTAQLGWKDKVYVDASYRQDWYRAFRQFANRGLSESYGYFGLGANAVMSQLFKLPEVVSYAKYRLSYSEVGNSIPNIFFSKGSENLETGAVSPSPYNHFRNPIPEKSKSFETGIEASFFDSRLDLDLTYYHALSTNQYMIATFADGKATPINSAKTRNQGIEVTVGYNFRLQNDFTWRTAVNFSYNDNKILRTAYNEDGSEALIAGGMAGVRVRYREGGEMGDMYVTDYERTPEGGIVSNGFFRQNADGTFTPYKYKILDGKIAIDENNHAIEKEYQGDINGFGTLKYETSNDKLYEKYVGNMNSKWLLGWSNTMNYKGVTLSFLINGRIGGKVVSLTEGYLDNLGLSQRSADSRLNAEKNGWDYKGEALMPLPDASGRYVPVKSYYESVGGSKNPIEYIYDGTNFRLRELSLGYTFKNLLGAGKNLNLSLIGRNLFFLYIKAPVDPDVSLSSGNGMSAFELYNMPSTRSFGFSLKLDM